jgi:DNA-binding MarR family transcriptional regulator
MDTLIRTADSVNIDRLWMAPGFLIRLAQLKVYEQFFSQVGERGLRPGEFSVLWVIKNNPAIRQSILGQSLMIKRAHMTKLIRALEDQGLVARHIPDDDRRAVELTLTPDGQTQVEAAAKWFFNYEDSIGSSLETAERQELVRLLQKFIAG